MTTSKSPSLGFLKAARARHAEDAIGRSEGLVTVLRLTQADLKPAEESIRIAKELFAAREFSKAVEEARRAETLAITLDERHSGYRKAEKGLKDVIESMRKLGLHTEALEGALGRAEEKILAGIWENGSFVPNYLEARVMIENVEKEGRALLAKASQASNAIFLAELATESLVEVPGPADPKAFAEGASAGLEASIHDATRELALANVDEAIRIAKDIEARATKLRAEYVEALRLLTATEIQLSELRGEGITTERVERQVEQAQSMLQKGIIEPGALMAHRLSNEARSLGETYRAATTGLQDAELLYAQLQREGFQSYEADSAIRDARQSIHGGNYARALEHLQRAHTAFVRRRNAREALAKALEDARSRVEVLRDKGLAFIPDVQELLGRAEREFRDGNYSGSSEDLRIATLLLGQGNGSQRRS